jgi:hypothetical protein
MPLATSARSVRSEAQETHGRPTVVREALSRAPLQTGGAQHDLWHDPPMAKSKARPVESSPVGKIEWLDDVAEHDYAAAEAYLSIKLDQSVVAKAIARLRKAPLTTRRANDILRAAGLTAAPLDDPGVMKDLIKVIERTRLSPVLVISDGSRADIADGYHRVSLVYRIDPYGDVPLKLA